MERRTGTGESLKKYLKFDTNNNCAVPGNNISVPRTIQITTLPVEVVLEILSYLSNDELHILRHVSKFFQRITRDPVLWKTYEVRQHKLGTSEVIDELKRMPLLRKFSMHARCDSDDILKQVSLSNKNLEELYIADCTGSTAKLYLRSAYLIHILQRCFRLHTISILGSRFRGCKFYRLLGNMGLRLKVVSTQATGMQFRTFIKHAMQIDSKNRQAICTMCANVKRYWAPLHYVVTNYNDCHCAIFITYLSKEHSCIFRSQ